MKKILSLLAFNLMYVMVSGQQPYETFLFTLNGSGAFPIGNFKNTVAPDGGAFGIGGGASALFNPKAKSEYFPVFFGVDFNYMSFGRDKQASTQNMPALKTGFNYYGISGISRIFLSAKKTGFVPFIDGQVGINIINTRTKIDKDVVDLIVGEDYPEVLNTTNDAGLMYSGSLGFYTRKYNIETGKRSASFFMKAGYFAGNDVKHVKRGTMKIENGEVTYQTTTTSVNNIIVQFGVVLPM